MQKHPLCCSLKKKKNLERDDILVSIIDHGIGEIDDIIKIFCSHIAEALNVIPFVS